MMSPQVYVEGYVLLVYAAALSKTLAGEVRAKSEFCMNDDG
jgi:hypothetical protein